MCSVRTVCGPLVLCFLVSLPGLFAQVDTGAILGTVTDSSGAPVPHAKVTILNEGTGIPVTSQTREDGTYIFTPVRIGTYSVSAQAAGFREVKQTGYTVNIQQQLVVDFKLTIGEMAQTIEVQGTAPLLQTQSGSVGQVVQAASINNLPLSGRNYNFLARLTAGVTHSQPEGRGLNSNGWFTANGARAAQNNFLLDGIDNNSNNVDFLSGAAYVLKPPVDAVAEFKLQTSAFSAEFGRAGGAVLNATIKSGTNDLHGSAWEFLRNDKLDAADYFQHAPGLKKSIFKQNQFGVAAGGRIARNKTFWFADYEGTRIRQESLATVSVPTMAERSSGFTNFFDLISLQSGNKGTDALGRTIANGMIFDPTTTRQLADGKWVRDPFAGNVIPASRLSPVAVNLIKLYPEPTRSDRLYNNYETNRGNRNDTNSFDVRMDHNFSDKDFAFVRYSFAQNPRVTPGPFDGYADGTSWGQGTQLTRTQGAALSHTHSFSASLINEVRFGFNREHVNYTQPFADETGVPDKFGIPGVVQGAGNGGLPTLAVGGLRGLGSPGWLPSERFSNTYQLSENLTKVYGSHTFKGGVEVQRIDFPWMAPPQSRGYMSFNGAYLSSPNLPDSSAGRAQFLLKQGDNGVGGPNQVSISNFGGVASERRYYGFYFQDDWKIGRKLTLNLGIRADHFGATGEKYGAQGNLVPGAHPKFLLPASRKGKPALSPSFINLLAKDGIELVYTDDYGSGLSKVPVLNFAPRFGFAYQMHSKHVLRGGYGIYYGSFENRGGWPSLGYNYPFQYQFDFYAPNDLSPIKFGDSSVATLEHGFTSIPLDPAKVNGAGLSFRGIEFDYKNAYTQSFNLTWQYEFLPSHSLEVGYVGSLARHLEAYPGTNRPTQILTPGTNQANYIQFPDFAAGASYGSTNGNSHYHSMQTKYTKRMSAGLEFLLAYTWAKTLTNAGDALSGGNIGGYRAPLLSGFGMKKEMALASFDIRHAFTYSGTYEMPFGRGRKFLSAANGFTQALLGGWSSNWIVTFYSGQPQTIGCQVTTVSGMGCFAQQVGGVDPYAGKHNTDQFYNPAAFTSPPKATAIGQTDFSPLGGYKTPVTGPPFHKMDLSLFKQFRVTEKTRAEFRAESFNLTNTPSFANPSNVNYTDIANFGKITSTRNNPNDARQIQLALKFYW